MKWLAEMQQQMDEAPIVCNGTDPGYFQPYEVQRWLGEIVNLDLDLAENGVDLDKIQINRREAVYGDDQDYMYEKEEFMYEGEVMFDKYTVTELRYTWDIVKVFKGSGYTQERANKLARYIVNHYMEIKYPC